MSKHWSDNAVGDIIGAFRVFFVSAVVIYIALLIAKALYPTFPLGNSSSGVISVILGIFLVLLKFVKGKNSFM